MFRTGLTWSVAAALCLGAWVAPLAEAQSTKQQGQALLARLKDEAARKSLVMRDKLSIYAGRIRVGSVEMKTRIEGDNLVLEDSFEFMISNVGSTSLKFSHSMNFKGELVEAQMVTKAPDSVGRRVERQYFIRPKGQGLEWTFTHKGKTTKKTIASSSQVMVLAPPLGMAARLPKLAKADGSYSFSAIDLETGSKTRLRLTIDPVADNAFRARRLASRLVTRKEAAASLQMLVDTERRVLQIKAPDGRMKLVTGLENSELYMSLPEPMKADAKDPSSVVVRFFRDVANGKTDSVKQALDFDGLYAAAKAGAKVDAKGVKPGDNKTDNKAERAAFEKAFLEALLKDNWVVSRRLSLRSGHLKPSELKVTLKGDEARVTVPGGGALRLRKIKEAWKIRAFEKAQRNKEGSSGKSG